MGKKQMFEEVMDKLHLLVKKEERLIPFDVIKRIMVNSVLDLKGKEMHGIFFKFEAMITTKEGDILTDELVDRLASDIAQRGFVVLAGDYIYEMISCELVREDKAIKAIKETINVHSEEDSLKKISDCLVTITPYAVFILLNESSALEGEVSVFYDSKIHPKKKSVSILFVDVLPENSCKFLTKKTNKKKRSYLICTSTDFIKLCKSEEKNCFFTKHARISATQIQRHINAPYSKLIVTDKYDGVDSLILELMHQDR